MADQHFAPQNAKTGVFMVKMPEFLLHSATYGLIVLEVGFRVKGIIKQDLYFATLAQWLAEDVEIEVSDVLLYLPQKWIMMI